MSETKHTPGPWEVEDPMSAEIGLSIVQAGLKTYEWEFIAMVCQSTAGDELMGRQRFISPKEQEANARLIAAAPDLLEALKVCAALIHLQNGNLHQDTNAILEMARLAVVKAEGPSPSENMEG